MFLWYRHLALTIVYLSDEFYLLPSLVAQSGDITSLHWVGNHLHHACMLPSLSEDEKWPFRTVLLDSLGGLSGDRNLRIYAFLLVQQRSDEYKRKSHQITV